MPYHADDGTLLYPIAEALTEAHLSRATFFRWVRIGRIPDARLRDRNGYRVFSREEVEAMRRESTRTSAVVGAHVRVPLKFPDVK